LLLLFTIFHDNPSSTRLSSFLSFFLSAHLFISLCLYSRPPSSPIAHRQQRQLLLYPTWRQ
jgi:hypothetical protein